MKVINNLKEKLQSAKDSILSTKEKFVEGLNQVIWVDIDKIHTDEYKDFLKLDKNRVSAIANSMKKEGIKVEHPLICIYKNHKFYLRDGQHRLNAGKIIHAAKLPVIVKSFDSKEQEAAYISDIELLSRHLTDYEFLVLLERKYKAMEQTEQSKAAFISEMATLFGKSERSIYNGLSLLKNCDDNIRSEIQAGKLTINAAISQLKKKAITEDANERKPKVSKDAKDLRRFCNFTLRNLYFKYSYCDITTASESIIDVWFKNRTNIDDDGYIIDYSIVEKGHFDYLRRRVDDESDTDGLSEVFGLSDEDDDPPPIMPTYNLDDF